MENTTENPHLEPLTPEQMVEYIEIFHMECDKTSEQILAGEDYTLTATDETADLLLRINFFTDGLHREPSKFYPVGTSIPLNDASEDFIALYKDALNAKEKYTGYLTAHWGFDYAFLRTEHTEAYPAEMYWFYKNIPGEILRRVYIEKDGMTLMQYLDFLLTYKLDWDKGPWLEYDGTGNIIKRENISEKFIAHFNELFWNEPRYKATKELMLEYGLSEENPMTFEWVVAYPKEAYTLINTAWGFNTIFPVRGRTFGDGFFENNNIPILPLEEKDVQ